MSFKRAFVAAVFALAAAPALAAAATPAPVQPAANPAPAEPARPAPVKATPEMRAEAERLEPLGRAAFWAREVDIDPTDYDARLKLSRALRAMGKYEEAAAAADQLLVIQPNNVEALLESARARVAENQGFYAIDDAQRAETLAPRDWRPVALLAIAYEQSDRDAEALAAHQKALTLAPDNPATLTNLGMYYATHGDTASAEPLLRRAAAAPGAAAQERQNLALVLGLEGKFDEAEQLERRDLPPDMVRANLDYLHADAQPPNPRTWDTLRADQ
ncbi:MAG TPA: tetratricopeptide repeat protein [Caulobacteraceae bacterium]|jgi:Flp pilus assembly protein TadD|nr:tetratricopeptide repeat protein [Caulobacteraceae bacterium]